MLWLLQKVSSCFASHVGWADVLILCKTQNTDTQLPGTSRLHSCPRCASYRMAHGWNAWRKLYFSPLSWSTAHTFGISYFKRRTARSLRLLLHISRNYLRNPCTASISTAATVRFGILLYEHYAVILRHVNMVIYNMQLQWSLVIYIVMVIVCQWSLFLNLSRSEITITLQDWPIIFQYVSRMIDASLLIDWFQTRPTSGVPVHLQY
jgi:hypothetical protein